MLEVNQVRCELPFAPLIAPGKNLGTRVAKVKASVLPISSLGAGYRAKQTQNAPPSIRKDPSVRSRHRTVSNRDLRFVLGNLNHDVSLMRQALTRSSKMVRSREFFVKNAARSNSLLASLKRFNLKSKSPRTADNKW